jgi:adenylyl-sulfate kinase
LAEVAAEEAQRPRSTNVLWEHATVGRDLREQRQGHKGAVLWFTGLSGSGKSTIAQQLERRLFALGCQVIYLDGDNVRHGLNGDLGFSPEDRKENIRRVAEVARLTFENGLLTLCALISPFAAERQFARSLFPAGRFVEIYVQCDPAVAMRRDPKGLYAKAQRGEIQGFTGVHQPYEPPQNPELTLDTMSGSPEDHVAEIISYLKHKGLI